MTPRPTYTAVGQPITDVHTAGCTTFIGIHRGSDGLLVLEVEEHLQDRPLVREYAEVFFSLDGFRRLRDLITAAIAQAEAA